MCVCGCHTAALHTMSLRGVTGRHAKRGFVVKSFGEEGERDSEIGGVEKRGLHGEYFNTKTYQLARAASLARIDRYTHTYCM